MITGTVTADREAVIRLAVRGQALQPTPQRARRG